MHTHETIITNEIMKYPPSSFHPFSSLSPPSNPGNHGLLSITVGSIFLESYKNGILLYILLVFNFVWFLSLNVSVFISIMHVLVAHPFYSDFCIITMYECTTICVSSHLKYLMNIWPMNSFWLLQMKPFWTFVNILCFFFPSWVDAVRPQNILPPKYISLSYIKMTILKNCRQH